MDNKKLAEYGIQGAKLGAPVKNFTSPSHPKKKLNNMPSKNKIKTIKDEIEYLTQISLAVQEKNNELKLLGQKEVENNTSYKTVDEKMNFEKKTEKSGKLETTRMILKNSAYNIYKLQLIQFAESIKRIYRNKNGTEYYIKFDTTEENIPDIILNSKDYNNMISVRDKYSNNDIFTSFIAKENCINPNSIKNNEQRNLTPTKNCNNILKNIKNSNRYSKSEIKAVPISNSNEKTIGEFQLSSYNICHQCKLQKMNEDLIKCQYTEKKILQNQKNHHHSHHHTCERSKSYNNIIPNRNNNHHNPKNDNQNNVNNQNNFINYFFVGESLLILTNKIYYLQNYDDSIKELINNYFIGRKNQELKKCEKYYCKNCLRTIYDIDIAEISKKNFKCPSCNNKCNCTRCIRYENLIKQIAYYLNNFGDIEKLYNYLIEQNSIFKQLKEFLVLTKFIPINCNNIKSSNNKNENEEKNEEPIKLLEYKNELEKLQNYFSKNFDETSIQKEKYDIELMKLKGYTIKKNFVKIKSEDKNEKSENEDKKTLLGKKRKRKKKKGKKK